MPNILRFGRFTFEFEFFLLLFTQTCWGFIAEFPLIVIFPNSRNFIEFDPSVSLGIAFICFNWSLDQAVPDVLNFAC